MCCGSTFVLTVYVAIPRPLFNYVAIVPVTYTIEAVILMNMLVPCTYDFYSK